MAVFCISTSVRMNASRDKLTVPFRCAMIPTARPPPPPLFSRILNMQRSIKSSGLQNALSRSKRACLSVELLEPRLNLALDVPAFSSLPGSNHTIYLDFDGHVTSGTAWNNGATINSPAYSSDADKANFSASELLVIERTFKRVAEDFAPFQVNVTTVAPTVEDLRNTGGADTKWGVRTVVTTDVAFNCGCGGIAYIDSFDWNSDTPVFVFNTSEIGVAEAVSHEVGHSLGLAHDGTSTASYYQGHGLGTDSTYWSTIMGVGYYVDLSQWDKGEYTGSNNAGASANYNKGPDDLAAITNYNGFGYKVDDHGNSASTATPLVETGTSITGSGLISTRTDVDFFRFTTSGGNVTLNVNPAAVGANLDIEASLFNSAGTLIASSNPLQALNASIATVVTSGEYFLRIDGVGAGTPTASPATGYTDYASIGAYTIAATVSPAVGDSLSIVATNASRNEGNSGSNEFTFTVNRGGDTASTSTVTYTVTGTGVAPAAASDFVGGAFPTGSLTFALGETSQIVTVYVQGDTAIESSETFAVSLSKASVGTVIATDSATGTILNDDSATVAPTLTVSATNAIKPEGTTTGSTPFVFTISRAGNLAGSSSVRYTVAGVSPNKASSSDFAGGFPQNVLVNFASGVSSVDIAVNVRADSTTEANETFRVALSSPTGATIASASANGIIQNDDGGTAAAGTEAWKPGIDIVLIAVADPLWMFVPPEYLSAEQLAVPVMTWIDGVSYVGDLAHDHEHDHELEHFELADVSEVASETRLVTPMDFESGLQRLSSLLPSTRTSDAALAVDVEAELESPWLDAFDSATTFGAAANSSSERLASSGSESDFNIEALDAALASADEVWSDLLDLRN